MSTPRKISDYPWRRHEVPKEEIDMDIPDGDAERGKQLFSRACGGCHGLYENNWLGPGLRDVFNRKIGSKKGFFYSTAMSLTKGHWTKQRLNVFLENPEEVVPHTAMFFDGIKSPYDRACIIEYLQYLKSTADPNESFKTKRIVEKNVIEERDEKDVGETE